MSAPGVGVHPDLPDTLVHFTGRPRHPGDVPPAFAEEESDGGLAKFAASIAIEAANGYAQAKGEVVAADSGAQARLMNILLTGRLRGATVFGSSQPVICFSEPSQAARRVMLRDGVVASRGPYAPWGLMLNREALIARGVRPVLYLSSEEMAATEELPVKLRNRRVRYDPGSADWLHEREWRLCFDEGEEPELLITPDLVAGVIVGRQGWIPPVFTVRNTLELSPGVTVQHVRSPRYAHGLARWWWTGEDLVADGTIDLTGPDGDGDGRSPYELRVGL